MIIIGTIPENIFTYDLDSTMTIEKAMDYDCIYISGGDTKYLLRRMKETGFDSIIKKFVYANKVYVGISAGSMIAKPNLSNSYDNEYIGLCLVNAYLGVHYEPGTPPIMTFPLEHIPLTDNQALAVSWSGYELVE